MTKEEKRKYDKQNYQDHKKERIEYQKKYKLEHPEKRKESDRKYRLKNSEKAKAYNKKWKQENPEKVRVLSRKWKQENPEKVKATSKKWRQENPEYAKALAEAYKAGWLLWLIGQGYQMIDFQSVNYHHPDPTEKEFNISEFIKSHILNSKNESLLRVELQKCIPLTRAEHIRWHMKSRR